MDNPFYSKLKIAPGEDTLVIERTFDAPRALVWKVWTEPEHILRWWGPKPFTAPVIKIDFRVGGTYHYCMRSPEGQDFWSTGVFLEILPQEKIVWTDCFADEQGNVIPPSAYGMGDDFPAELVGLALFEEIAGKTKLTLRYEGIPDGPMREMTVAGWSTSLEKFAEALDELR